MTGEHVSDETAIPVVGMLRPRWGAPARTAELPGAAAALAGDRKADAGVDPGQLEEVTDEDSPGFGIDGCSAPNFATAALS